MAVKRKGGCLSVLLFLMVLILSILLIAVLFSSVKSTGGGTLLTEILEKAGFDMSDEPEDSASEEEPQYSGGLSDLIPDDTIRIEITQDKLRELLEDAMEDRFPLTLDELTLHAAGTMQISGKAERDRFLEILDSAETALGALERMALQLAPEELSFSVTFALDYDAFAGTIALDPQSMSVESLNLPVSYLPDAWMGGLNHAITDYFASYGRTPAGISVYEGYLHLYFD